MHIWGSDVQQVPDNEVAVDSTCCQQGTMGTEGAACYRVRVVLTRRIEGRHGQVFQGFRRGLKTKGLGIRCY